MALVAFIDESQSDRQRDPDTYILSAVVCSEVNLETSRQTMEGLRCGGTKLHWRDEKPARQQLIAERIASLRLECIVTVHEGRPGETDKRRRNLCMNALMLALDEMGVSNVVLESRGPADDRRDTNLVSRLRADRRLSTQLRIAHLPGPQEAMLWAADAVCGAVTAARLGQTAYLASLREGGTRIRSLEA